MCMLCDMFLLLTCYSTKVCRSKALPSLCFQVIYIQRKINLLCLCLCLSNYMIRGDLNDWNTANMRVGSTIGTNGISMSFKVLSMVPLVIPLVPMVPNWYQW